MSSQQWDLVYALWQEIPKLVYAFWTLQPVFIAESRFPPTDMHCAEPLWFSISPDAFGSMVFMAYRLGHPQYILGATDPNSGFCALSEETKFKKNLQEFFLSEIF